ncbi:MAG: hypothetical protein IJZ39_01550 [Oscillospiraceae bacterium]|nr:hypothetical protein [Oscillospiraceae bacterium]
MSSYILVGRRKTDKRWWNDLVRACAVVGDAFEIHCWYDERAEITIARRFGQQIESGWHGGMVFRGRITREFLSFLTEMKKPDDIDIYNKMTPFFTIQFGDRLYSEHYGTEMTISPSVEDRRGGIERILNEMEHYGTVHRDLG